MKHLEGRSNVLEMKFGPIWMFFFIGCFSSTVVIRLLSHYTAEEFENGGFTLAENASNAFPVHTWPQIRGI